MLENQHFNWRFWDYSSLILGVLEANPSLTSQHTPFVAIDPA
jgi:hypothetical protein